MSSDPPPPTTSFVSNVSLNSYTTTSGAQTPTLTFNNAGGNAAPKLLSGGANLLKVDGNLTIGRSGTTGSTAGVLTIEQPNGAILSNQTLTGVLTEKTSGEAVPAGIQFSNDAGFFIPNPAGGNPLNVRISDLYSGANLEQLQNVVAALCRACYRQISDQSLNAGSGATDQGWIQAFAENHKPYDDS